MQWLLICCIVLAVYAQIDPVYTLTPSPSAGGEVPLSPDKDAVQALTKTVRVLCIITVSGFGALSIIILCFMVCMTGFITRRPNLENDGYTYFGVGRG